MANQGFYIQNNATPQGLKIEIEYTELQQVKHPRLAELLGEAFSLQSEFDKLSAEARKGRIATVTAEHKVVKAAARRARDLLNQAKQNELQYQNAQLSAEANHRRALRALSGQADLRPQPADYPTDKEIKRWEDNVVQAKVVAEEEATAFQVASNNYFLFKHELGDLEEKFKAAQIEESEVRAKLNALTGVKSEDDRNTFGL